MAVQVALRNKARESATILDSSVLEPYNESIKRYDPKLRQILRRFGESETQLTGASDLMNGCLVNSGLLPKDARLATRENLETAISKAKDFFSGFYVCCGLNLVTPKDEDYQVNPVFANSLAKDLKKVGIVDLKNAKLIPYNILICPINKKSPEGLVFKLSEEGKDTAKKIILNTDDFKWEYSPNTSGLFGAFLGDGYWDARSEYLAGSGPGGRVVVVSGEATSKKILDRYTLKFKEERDKVIAGANKKYAKMKKSLRVA